MITRLSLKNFAAFEDLSIDFSPKINVIIGENGCGKTQFLKAAYTLTCAGNELEAEAKVTKTKAQEKITEKLLKVYKPSGDKIGALNHRGSNAGSEIFAEYASGCSLQCTFTAKSNQIKLNDKFTPLGAGAGVFIPTKEILSFLEGISSKDAHRPTIESLFDDTYFDLVHRLITPADNLEKKAQWANEKISNRIGGRFEFEGSQVQFKSGEYKEYKSKHASETYFAPASQPALSATMTAEGFRKVGVLQWLLQNSAVGTGTNGPLFWDEPEANMNPKLMSLVVEILLELSRNGQQIIVATHDYVLLKWFDLLMDKKGKGDHVKFHALYRKEGIVKSETAESYKHLDANAISATYSELYDAEIERALGSASA